MKNPKVRQIILPLITAMIWGSSFVTQSLSAGHLGCFSFNALRAIPAVLVLLVLLAVMHIFLNKTLAGLQQHQLYVMVDHVISILYLDSDILVVGQCRILV
mgnify:CR=1 FL=1